MASRHLLLAALIPAACAAPGCEEAPEYNELRLDRVDPNEADPMTPQRIDIFGEGIEKRVVSNVDDGTYSSSSLSGSLAGDAVSMELTGVAIAAEGQISAMAPGLPEGVYDVNIEFSDGRRAALPRSYGVGMPPPNAPDAGAGADGCSQMTWYHDADCDGFADPTDTRQSCSDPTEDGDCWVLSTDPVDCDDQNKDVYPGTACDDGMDGTYLDTCLNDGNCAGVDPSCPDDCSEGCGPSGCCTQSCSGTACAECPAGCVCNTDCPDQTECTTSCASGSVCGLTATDLDGSADLTCPSNTSCSLTCGSGNPEDSFCTLTCESGASCVIDCGGVSSCTFECADDPPDGTDCGGGVRACNRPCPP